MNTHQYQRAALLRCRSPYARIVLMALTTYASGDGPGWRVWPGNEALLALTGVSAPTLARTLRELEADGWISRSTSGPLRREITLTHPPLRDQAPPSDGSGTMITQIMQGDLSEHGLADAASQTPPHTPLCEIMQGDLSDQASPSERSGTMISQRGPENEPCRSSSRKEESRADASRDGSVGGLATGQRERKKTAPAPPVTDTLPLRAHTREPARETRRGDGAPTHAPDRGEQLQAQPSLSLSGGAGGEAPTLEAAWARLWGGGAPCPPALLWLQRQEGAEAALTALAWLLFKRAGVEGVKSPARMADYLADDLRAGRRERRAWAWGELVGCNEGADPRSFAPPSAQEASREGVAAAWDEARAAFVARNGGRS